MVKIRLSPTKKGSKHFRIVVIDARFHNRSGNFIDIIGSYNSIKVTDNLIDKVVMNMDKYDEYIKQGAQPTDPVLKLEKKYRAHIQKIAQSSK